MARPALPSSIILRLLGLWLVLTSVWYLVFLIVGDDLRALGYVNAAGFWIGVSALLVAAILWTSRRFLFGTLAFGLGTAILATGGPYAPVARKSLPQQAMPLRIVTASLRSLNTDMGGAAAMLAGVSADIVVLQEASRPALLVSLLERRSRRRWFVATAGTQVTLSRWPLLHAVRRRDLLEVEIASPAGRFRVWNVRAPKSFTAPVQNRLYTATLVDRVAAAGNRGIAAGDFNATPWNDGYRDLHRLLDDVRDRSGWGPGFTFPTRSRRMGALGPFLRIDHILADPRFVPVAVRTVAASPGADHLPVVADYRVAISPRAKP